MAIDPKILAELNAPSSISPEILSELNGVPIAKTEAKNPSTLESAKAGFMEQPLPEGASGWDKLVAFVGEEGPVIAGGTIGAIKGAAGGALLGPGGALAGGAMGGMLGAGAVRAAQEGIQQIAGTEETVAESAKAVGKSAIEGASGELLGPGIKATGRLLNLTRRGVSRALGWTSGLSSGAVERIMSDPDMVLGKMFKYTKYDIEDAARKVAQAVDKSSADEGVRAAVKRVLEDKDPVAALTHILKSGGEEKDLVLRIGKYPAGTSGAANASETLLEDFIQKKIAFDSSQILNTAGIADISSSPSALLAAVGVLHMSLAPAAPAFALKSPLVAAVTAAVDAKVSRAAGKVTDKVMNSKAGKKAIIGAGQAIAHSTPDEE